MAWLTFERGQVEFSDGLPRVYRSSQGVVRQFCGTCGSQLSYEGRPTTIDITTASMDNPNLFPPTLEVWLEHRVSWQTADGIADTVSQEYSMTRRLISSGSHSNTTSATRVRSSTVEWVFVSGTTGFDYATMTISDNLLDQTEQCFKNIQSALQEAGAEFADVVRVTYVLPNALAFPNAGRSCATTSATCGPRR